MDFDLTALLTTLVNTVVVPGIAGLALYLIDRRVKDVQLRTLLSNAVKNSVGIAEEAANAQIRALKPSVNIPGVPEALQPNVQYVLDHADEAIKRFGVTPDQLTEKVMAQIGLLKLTAPAPLSPVPNASTTLARHAAAFAETRNAMSGIKRKPSRKIKAVRRR